MGVLSELVISDEGDAEKIGNSMPSTDLGGVDLSGIQSEHLSSLHEIVLGTSYDYDCDFASSGEDTWVFKIESKLVDALAAKDQAQQAEIARAWSKTDEFVLDSWSLDNVIETVRTICEQAQRASSSSQRLFLWVSL